MHKQLVPEISIISAKSNIKYIYSLSLLILFRSYKIKGLFTNNKNSTIEYKQFISKPLYNPKKA